jgi:perosamine synthetase
MIKVFQPWLEEEEKKKLAQCIDDNWITGGPRVKEFEKEIARLTDSRYTISCMNGTMALYMGLSAMELGKTGYYEVIVPDFTFIASANSIVLAGGHPVFCDVKRDTMNIDVNSAAKCITPWTRAIMPVHIYGQAANMDEVREFAEKYHLKIIEDAAQGVGVSWREKAVGTFGDVGIHSYYADKTISTGEGGMILTNNPEIAEKCLRLKHQGRTGRGWYFHNEIGYNFRMTDLQASIGLAQLGKLSTIINRKKLHEIRYRTELHIEQIEFPTNDSLSYSIPFRHNILVENPVKLGEYLLKHEIETKSFFYPLHLQPCYDDTHKGNGGSYRRDSNNFRNSIWLNEHGLSLPSSVTLTEEQIAIVCSTIKKYFKENPNEDIHNHSNS